MVTCSWLILVLVLTTDAMSRRGKSELDLPTLQIWFFIPNVPPALLQDKASTTGMPYCAVLHGLSRLWLFRL